jgi:branched-subunit amino acid transport protein AzlD
MNADIYIVLAILSAAAATFATRAAPFLLFGKTFEKNRFLEFLRKNMPIMIMVTLVFYSIKDVKFTQYSYGIAELIGIFSALLLHIKFKNALLSIISATIIYMILKQVLFA